MAQLSQVSEGQFQLSGELTRFKSLDSLNVTANGTQVELNLAALSLVDTAGLAWLLQQGIKLDNQGCQLEIVNPSDKLIKLARISGVDDILGV
ncbi:STAS domain-containing protein [Catenovulum sp. SM1970]|uniref:STAS domain-containing protein n=1 Tax=Marinifaba aquimaris TaxID=2741323 RepID=UPI0015721006|nr:STAS domain-containing protein [Marinifaba aquimaris]NTS75901.1 STAS domain-containing protein [Marinifaba aquimaris]